jgi:hypothetical protein
MSKKLQNYINHIVFVVDSSGSMGHLSNEVVKVNPASHNAFDIFVQSTSTNRKLIKGTKLLVLK